MIVRSTYEKCIRVRKILQTHMVQFEERDIFMSQENQRDLRERLEQVELEVPQVFADGQRLGVSGKVFIVFYPSNKFSLHNAFKRILIPYTQQLYGQIKLQSDVYDVYMHMLDTGFGFFWTMEETGKKLN